MGVVQLAELSRNGEAGGGRRRWRNTRRLRMAGWSGWPPARIDGDGGWGGRGAGGAEQERDDPSTSFPSEQLKTAQSMHVMILLKCKV